MTDAQAEIAVNLGSAMSEAVDARLSTLRQEWATLHSTVPRFLHHYTTLAGMTGILESDSMWFSDVRYMNDASELAYASSIIDSIVHDTVQSHKNAAVREVLPASFGMLEVTHGPYGSMPFIACFCAEGDLLSQWRAYAGQVGVSLGLDLKNLVDFGNMPDGTVLRRVIYRKEEQAEAVQTRVDAWIAAVESVVSLGGQFTPDLVGPHAVAALRKELSEQLLCFKDPGFAEEKEWRLIRMVSVEAESFLRRQQASDRRIHERREQMRADGEDVSDYFPLVHYDPNVELTEVDFRSTPQGLVPFISVPLIQPRAGLNIGRLVLREVMQGPTLSPMSLESLRYYVELKQGFTHVKVAGSTIPLRF